MSPIRSAELEAANRNLERRLDEAMHLSLHLLAIDALKLQGKRGL